MPRTMRKLLKLFSIRWARISNIGTSSLTDKADSNRVRMVNRLCVITASSILTIGGTVCYLYDWKPHLVIGFLLEFGINALVLYYNSRKQHKTATIILYFLQCAMLIYLSAILGHLLRLEIVVITGLAR